MATPYERLTRISELQKQITEQIAKLILEDHGYTEKHLGDFIRDEDVFHAEAVDALMPVDFSASDLYADPFHNAYYRVVIPNMHFGELLQLADFKVAERWHQDSIGWRYWLAWAGNNPDYEIQSADLCFKSNECLP